MRLRSGPLPGPAPAANTIACGGADVRARVVGLEVAEDRLRAHRLEVGGVVGVADEAAAAVAVVGEQLEEAERDLAVSAGDEDFHGVAIPAMRGARPA